jgi:hypothetical protein
MNKEFIPYEQALALKELGFDESCFTHYLNKVLLTSSLVIDKRERNSSFDDIRVTAPTYSQAFRWFREKYQLHNGIYPYYDEYEFQIKDFRLPTNTPINGGLMKYEEAELACLIKLIEIVKKK